jgi:hypothetical protein
VGYFFGLVCVGFNFKSGLPATINSKIQARVTDCNINFKVFFSLCGPGDEVAKKNWLGLPICYAGGLIGMT